MRGISMLGRAFVGASVAWALALPLAPFAVAHAASTYVWSAFVLGVYACGSLICHQLPERSFHLGSVPWPVCARCTGIYLGAALAAIGAVLGRGPVAPRIKSRTALMVAALPTAVTLAYEWMTTQTPANWIRAVAGLPLGAVIALIIVDACATTSARK